MFAAACDPLPPQRHVESAGIANDLLDCFPVAAASQRIFSIVIERNVQDRAQIQIETEEAKQSSRDVPMTFDKFQVILVAQLLRIRRLATDQSEPRNAAPFLINGNNRLDLT